MAKKFNFSQLQKAEEQRKKDASESIEIMILDEFKNLIPPLASEEYSELEKSILTEGCRESLIVWKKGENYCLVDGHNRYEICQKHQIEFKIIVKYFDNEAEVRAWMLNNQLGRRNLTAQQTSYLRGLKYENDKQRGFRQNVGNEQTAEKVALEFNISNRTVERDALFAKGLDKIGDSNAELKRDILSGKIKVNKNHIQEISKMEILPKVETVTDINRLFKLEKVEVLAIKTELELKKERLIELLNVKKQTAKSIKELEKVFTELVLGLRK